MTLSEELLVGAFFAQIVWTMVVGFLTGRARFGAAGAGRIKGDIALSDAGWPDDVRKVANNFNNQWETPTLFYALILMALQREQLMTTRWLVLAGVFGAVDPSSAIRHYQPGATTALITFGILAASAVIFTAAYLLWTFQRVYMGPAKPEHEHFAPVTRLEKGILMSFAAAAILWGVLPGMLLLEPVNVTMVGMLKLIGG